MKENIHKFDSLDELKEFLEINTSENLKKDLLTDFKRLLNYKNIKEWNELVRVCESLSIIGWGDNEEFEATAEKWINGSYYTDIRNKYFEKKEEFCKKWKKKGESFIIDEDNSDNTNYNISKLLTQRNKIPKCPIRWSKSGNYQTSLEKFTNSLEILKTLMIRETKPELYGKSFSYIGFNLWFSNHDKGDFSVRSEYFHKEEDVPDEMVDKKNKGNMPLYYIRPKFKIGRLSKKENELRLIVTRHFTRNFGYLTLKEQQNILEEDFIEIIDKLSIKLNKKKINYNTKLLKEDIINIFSEWKKLCTT